MTVARPITPPSHGDAPLIMGVVNVTPDSFSDGGRYLDTDAAVVHARALVEAGADVVDVGGESTRPGSDPVAAADELARVVPVVSALAHELETPISIDTMKPEVAQACIAAGASMWNDVSALRFGAHSIAVAAELNVPVVLMHMLGMPKTMQDSPVYEDVAAETGGFLLERVRTAEVAGVHPNNIWIDPGIGFGKTLDHNLALMRSLKHVIETVGRPMVFGASRKRFIYGVDPRAKDEGDRLAGSLAASLWAVQAGAAMIRVHDVRETVQAVAIWRAIAEHDSCPVEALGATG